MEVIRLLAIDPGIVNLAMCVLEWDVAEPPPPALSLTSLNGCLVDGRLRVVEWLVLPLLASGRSGSIPAVLSGVVDFLLARAELMRSLHYVVIEQQMKASMKQVAACLYGGIRALCPRAAVTLQSAALKLAFGDLAAFSPDFSALATYAQRKKAAIAAASRLLPALAPAQADVFRRSKKKDDLADALLHGLAGCCTVGPAAARRRATGPGEGGPAKRARGSPSLRGAADAAG